MSCLQMSRFMDRDGISRRPVSGSPGIGECPVNLHLRYPLMQRLVSKSPETPICSALQELPLGIGIAQIYTIIGAVAGVAFFELRLEAG